MREQNQNVGICPSCAFVQPANVVLLIFLRIHEKDGKIKSVEELLQAEILKVASKEKTVQVFLCNIYLSFSVSVPLTTIYLLLHGILQ